MKSIAPAGLVAIALLAATAPTMAQQAVPAPAASAAVARKFIPGLGIANVEEAILASKAAKGAASEQQIVFRNQLAMLDARQKQINAELASLVEKFNRDRQAGNVPQADLQAQAQRIQTLQQTGSQELQTMREPVTRSEQYVREQVNGVINQAITAAMDKQGVTLVLPPNVSLAFNNGYNLTPAIVVELDRLLPTARVVPPAGWQPGGAPAAAQPAPAVRSGNGGR